MSIERATAKGFLLTPAERNMSWFLGPLPETLRSARALVIGFRSPSINISLLWSERNCVR